jgi:valyl-tRNA synthetase
VLLRLIAPVQPFVTEEVWSWWRPGQSIHRAPWPTTAELPPPGGLPDVWAAARQLLAQIRRAKTDAGRSLKATVALLVITETEDRFPLYHAVDDDIREAGSVVAVQHLKAGPDRPPNILVKLADA